jgi:hypothetical protein
MLGYDCGALPLPAQIMAVVASKLSESAAAEPCRCVVLTLLFGPVVAACGYGTGT